MKNLTRYLLAILLTTFCATATAQLGEIHHNLSVGGSAGVNLSSVAFEPTIKQGRKPGINAGITARYISEKYFNILAGIQMEVNYSGRGWKEDIEDEGENSYNRSTSYIEIPFLAHLAFGKNITERSSCFFINAGPQLGIFLSEKENQNKDWDMSLHRGVREQYGKKTENKIDYGIAAGIGGDINTRLGHFIIEGRMFFGLGNIYKDTKKDYFGRSANNYLSLRVAYLVDIF